MLPYFGMHLCSAILLKGHHFADKDIKIIESNDNVIERTFLGCWIGTFFFKTPPYRLMTKISRVTKRIALVSNKMGLFAPNSEMALIFDLNHNFLHVSLIILIFVLIVTQQLYTNKMLRHKNTHYLITK